MLPGLIVGGQILCSEWRQGQHAVVFPADRVCDSRDVLRRANDAWRAMVQPGRLQIQESSDTWRAGGVSVCSKTLQTSFPRPCTASRPLVHRFVPGSAGLSPAREAARMAALPGVTQAFLWRCTSANPAQTLSAAWRHAADGNSAGQPAAGRGASGRADRCASTRRGRRRCRG